MTVAAAPPIRHLRPRGGRATQPTTTVELFFDLVYVFAVTQLSHQILGDLTVAGVARLLLWIPALALELAAPAAGYWLPRRGHAVTTDYDIEGSHFAERCQPFIIIATAVGTDLLIAGPDHALHGVGLAMMLGGPALFLAGESLFGLRMTATTNLPRVVVAGCLVVLVPIGGQVSALLLGVTVGAMLSALVLWELRR